jgi:hypothetical protein
METLLEDPDFGVAVNGEHNLEARYLVADRVTPIEVRQVPQSGGGAKYAVDQKINPQTVVFWPGGIFDENCVIAGSVGTVSEGEVSLAIFSLFGIELRRQFKKIKSYHVGRQAEELLDKGWRLTTGTTTPLLYDLKK